VLVLKFLQLPDSKLEDYPFPLARSFLRSSSDWVNYSIALHEESFKLEDYKNQAQRNSNAKETSK
jgi:hypothetical protein